MAEQAAPWVRAKMQKEMEAGSWRGKAKTDATGRVIPNVLAQYKEDTMRTTGQTSHLCSRSDSLAGLRDLKK